MHEEGKRGTFFYSDVRIHPNEQKKCPSLSLFHIRNDKPYSVAKYWHFQCLQSFPHLLTDTFLVSTKYLCIENWLFTDLL